MEPTKRPAWPWVLVLLAGLWLAAGRPGIDSISVPSFGGAPFAVPDGLTTVVPVLNRAEASRDELTAEGLARKASDEQGLRYWEYDPTVAVPADAPEWRRNAAAANKQLGPGTRLMISGKSGEVLPLSGDPTAAIKKYGK